jgi:hypothetical protein
MLDDIDMLRLLEGLETTEGNDIESAQAIFDTPSNTQLQVPKLQDLVDAGWMRTIYRRVHTTLELMKAAQSGPLKDHAAFSSWLKSRYDTTFAFSTALSGDQKVADTVQRSGAGVWHPATSAVAARNGSPQDCGNVYCRIHPMPPQRSDAGWTDGRT